MKKFLLLCFSFVFAFAAAWAQERQVSGKVTSSEDGTSLPGVNVVLKGTTNGTVTDSNGSFRLTVPGAGGTIVFSFIGLQTQEVLLGERSTLDVALALDVQQLSEVVVTGTGAPTEKRRLAISVESVTASQLPIAPTASLDQALVGKIAGAQIQSGSGVPGADINILLRGINTINRGTSPIILVDGVQLGVTSLNSLDLSTVDRVEVIQGAAAGTIYGAQGANGVIQIFTKKGKEGALDINFSSSVAQNQYLNIGGLRKADLHGFNTNSSNQVIGSSGNPLTQDPATMVYSENLIWNSTDPATLINKPYDQNLKYHDHISEFFTSANTTNYSVSVAGAKNGVDFSFAASNNHQQSNFKGDGYNDRSNFTSNIGIQLAKGLKLRSITQLVYTNNTIDIYNKQDFGVNSLVYGIFNARPFVDYFAKASDGNYAYYYGDAAGVNQTNPNYTLQYNDTKDHKVDINQNFNLNYAFPKFVVLDLKYGINHQDRNVRYVGSNQSANANSENQQAWVGWYNGNDNTGEVSNFNYSQTFQNFLGSATASFDFDKDFKMSIPLRSVTQVAYDVRNTDYHRYITYGLGIPLDPPVTANQATSFKTQDDYTSKFLTYGYLVNQRFEWGEIATVSAGFRSDYSSAFGGGSKPFTFPRGDASFRISSLDFWDNSGIGNTILEWKLRAAYGKAGIQPQPFDRYVTLTTRTLGTSNSLYTGPNQSNPDLNVEVSAETELGTDMTLQALKGDWLKNINFSFTYWKRSTDNAIYRVEAPPTSGVGTVLDNAFSLSSHGLQASLNAAMLKKSNLSWNMTVNFGKQTSQIDAVKGNAQVVVTSNAGSTGYVLRAGEKIGQLYGFLMLHDVGAVDPKTGQPFIAPADQANYEVAGNGWVVDKARKAPYVTPNQYSFGDPFPKFNMSFINDFTFKNFLTVGIQFDWVQGNHLYNQTKEWMYRDGIHSDYTKPFSIGGETGAWSAFYRGVYAEVSRNGTKSYFYEDASFLRLRNLYIGFDVAKLVTIPKVKRLQVVLTGRNLATWTKYTGMDPEISSGTVNSAWDRGTDHNTLPNFKTYQATLNIGF
jgi:TonB-linked SusC/RagA family outer membrane protein